jgi:hypothetical protein
MVKGRRRRRSVRMGWRTALADKGRRGRVVRMRMKEVGSGAGSPARRGVVEDEGSAAVDMVVWCAACQVGVEGWLWVEARPRRLWERERGFVGGVAS